jgi:hypothetical protein
MANNEMTIKEELGKVTTMRKLKEFIQKNYPHVTFLNDIFGMLKIRFHSAQGNGYNIKYIDFKKNYMAYYPSFTDDKPSPVTEEGPIHDDDEIIVNNPTAFLAKLGRMSGGKKWSAKYKKSINCKRPKGFSQKQYCKYKNKSKSRRTKKHRR